MPVSPESTYTPERFRALLQRRLRLPLSVTARACNGASCRRELDVYGDHRAACSVAGRLVRRAGPVERIWARVCREGGARVQPNMFLRDMNLEGISADDGRRLEVVANGLPLYHGRQLAIDATIVSPLRADGFARAGAADTDGVALSAAVREKRVTYHELVRNMWCSFFFLRDLALSRSAAVGGPRRTNSSSSSPRPERAGHQQYCVPRWRTPSSGDGPA